MDPTTKKYSTLALIMCLMAYLWHINNHSPDYPANITSIITVNVEWARPNHEAQTVKTFGRLSAYNSAQVKSRIDGQITDIHFKEGDSVMAGQAMFSLDPRLLRAQLHQSQANLSRDQAQLELALFNLATTEKLVKKGFASLQDLENDRSLAEAAAASIDADRANIEVSEVQLSYTRINSPVSGLAGNTVLQLGNGVQANSTTLVTINQTHPLYVNFNLPERQVQGLRQLIRSGHDVAVRIEASEGGLQGTGRIVSLDNQLDRQSDTLLVRALVDNQDQNFLPGQFVHVSLDMAHPTPSVLIPKTALSRTPQGPCVYVVNAHNEIEQRPIRYHNIEADHVWVSEGLKSGEAVVSPINVQLNPGSKVKIANRPAAP